MGLSSAFQRASQRGTGVTGSRGGAETAERKVKMIFLRTEMIMEAFVFGEIHLHVETIGFEQTKETKGFVMRPQRPDLEDFSRRETIGRVLDSLTCCMRTRLFRLGGVLAAVVSLNPFAGASDAAPLRDQLKALPFKIAYESYVDGNSDIFVMNPDGSHPVNLTKTPGLNEHYPQISPDGARICFVADKGEGRDAIRSLYVMDMTGQDRKKIADYAREPFWSPDGKVIGFLDQEYPKFDVVDYYTKGMNFYDLATGKITPHPNYTNLHHLYNPGFCANGKWIVSTVHAGMGYDHTILLIEAHGNRDHRLENPRLPPSFQPRWQANRLGRRRP